MTTFLIPEDLEQLSVESWKRPISKMSSGSIGHEKSEKIMLVYVRNSECIIFRCLSEITLQIMRTERRYTFS